MNYIILAVIFVAACGEVSTIPEVTGPQGPPGEPGVQGETWDCTFTQVRKRWIEMECDSGVKVRLRGQIVETAE